MSNVGCRIFTEVPRPPKELVERCHAAQDSYAVTLRRR